MIFWLVIVICLLLQRAHTQTSFNKGICPLGLWYKKSNFWWIHLFITLIRTWDVNARNGLPISIQRDFFFNCLYICLNLEVLIIMLSLQIPAIYGRTMLLKFAKSDKTFYFTIKYRNFLMPSFWLLFNYNERLLELWNKTIN